MNSPIFAVFIGLIFAVTLFSLFYTWVAKPVLRDFFRFKLFAVRDKMRRMAIEEEVQPSSFHFMFLERVICRQIDHCTWYNWSSLFEFALFKRAEMSADAKRFQEKAPQELKLILAESVVYMMGMLGVNSPIITLVLIGVLKIAEMFGKAWQKALLVLAAIFFEGGEDGDGLQTA
jgi:hypothetical protein